MKGMSEKHLARIVAAAGLTLVRRPEGWVRIDPPAHLPSLRLTAQTDVSKSKSWNYQWIGRGSAKLYLVAIHPGGVVTHMSPKPLAKRFAPLRTHRFVRIESIEEAEDIIDLILERGGGQGSDAEVFDTTGTWLLRVSHHDEVHVTIPIRASAAS